MGKPRDWYDHVTDRAGHDFRYSNDSTKIRTELGWEPRYTVRDGWRRPSNGTGQNRAWWAIESAYAAKGQ